MKNIFYLMQLITATLLLPVSSNAQTPKEQTTNVTQQTKSIFDTWQSKEVLQLQLTTNMKKFVKGKKEEEKQAALLKYIDKNGQEKGHSVKIRARGNMRKDICSFPPIKLYYSKGFLDSMGLNKRYNDYKLVLSCKSQSTYQNYVLEEFLIYQLYNLLTDLSYQVQLIHLTIEDSENKYKTIESYGFIIENDEEMADRLGGTLIKPRVLSPRAIIPEHYDRMTLFQYMIGNTDWYMYNKHNMKILKRAGDSYPIIIPYDFDYSGIINASYAVPHEKLPIEYVRERFFLGMCREEGVYTPSLQLFRDKKAAILAACENFDLLNEKARKNTINYLNGFFNILEDDKKTRRNIIEHCDQHVKFD